MQISEIREEYSYQRELPKNFLERDAFRFSSIRECKVSRASLEHFNHVKVCQYYIFSGVSMLEDFCLPVQKRGKIKVWKQWLKLQFFPSLSVDEAIWVSDVWSKNYFHWILECLPRILAIRKSGINSPLLLPAHIYAASYVQDSLNDLGIETITFNFRQTVTVNSLYVASHDSPCAFDSTYLLDLTLRYKIIDVSKSKVGFRKVYISRESASKRKVFNEHELIPILKGAGFEIVQMEKLSFKEQRDLMRETKVLMGIHGAGLSNLIFLNRNSKVLELHPDVDRYNSCFYHLAAALNIDYYYSFEEGDHSNPQEANINVDLENIRKLLKTL